MAESQSDPSELERQIGAIASQSQRASEIIRHLRSYGHADGGPLGAVDLSVAVGGALTLTAMPLAEASVRLEIDLPVDLPLVRARLVQIEQVLVNLMLNARDAMRTMAVRRLRISADASDTTVVMRVANTDPGIPAEAMTRLFDAFFHDEASW